MFDGILNVLVQSGAAHTLGDAKIEVIGVFAIIAIIAFFKMIQPEKGE